MAYLVEVPVDGGGRLVVEAEPSLLPSGLELAAARPGEIVARARESLEESLDQLRPALSALSNRLRALAPEEFTVEFGLSFGVETGLFIAKGKGDVHLSVTMSWKDTAGAGRPTSEGGAGPRSGTGTEPGSDRG